MVTKMIQVLEIATSQITSFPVLATLEFFRSLLNLGQTATEGFYGGANKTGGAP